MPRIDYTCTKDMRQCEIYLKLKYRDFLSLSSMESSVHLTFPDDAREVALHCADNHPCFNLVRKGETFRRLSSLNATIQTRCAQQI